MAKCTINPNEEAVWAWQPFGPDDDATQMTLLGNHYRGFPVVKIGDKARDDIKTGRLVTFRYKGQTYRFASGKFWELRVQVEDGQRTYYPTVVGR